MNAWRERFTAWGHAAWEAVRSLPRPTPAQWVKAAPFLVFGLALLVIVGRNLDTVDFPHYAAPEGFVAAPPPTTLPPDYQRPSLQPVAGATTTTIPANVGSSNLSGTVTGPNGVVTGAVVRVERSIGGQIQRTDVVTDGNGNWAAGGIGGGRYRVRAFLPPTLAQRTAEVFVLPAGESKRLELSMEEFSQPTVALGAAPAPALLDQQVNVAVRVTRRTVDQDGFVTAAPVVGAPVQVSHTSSWDQVGDDRGLVTDANGRVVVTFVCRHTGTVSVQATALVAAGAPSVIGTASFECVDPSTTTSSTVPGAVAGPGNDSSTTSTTSSSSTTSTTAAP